MKKKWLLITIIIAALGIGGIASAQVTAPNLWKIVSGSIRPVVSSWELGSATSRIQKGWFTNLDASNATIGSIAVSGTVSGDMVVGGQIRAANGTSTAPSYSFNSDTNTGLMWTGNDAFKFVNGGTDTLSISSSGQVKINTLASSTATLIMADTLGNLYSSADNRITSATSPLVLAANNLSITKASSTASGYLSNTDWSTFNSKVSSQWTTSGSNVYYTAGSVGIGTTAPSRKLEVSGDVLFGSAINTISSAVHTSIKADINEHGLIVENNGTAFFSFVSKNLQNDNMVLFGGGDSAGDRALEVRGGGTEGSFVVTGSSNVGIGTTAPGEKLEVNGNIKATGYKSSDGTIGTSTTINVRKADDSGACTITVKNGLVTATTCP